MISEGDFPRHIRLSERSVGRRV
ncbi:MULTISPECIES: AlpA family phage regulatory protein [Sphingobium]